MSKNFLMVLSCFILVYITMHIFAYAQGRYGYGENPQIQALKQKMEQDMQQIKADREKLKQDMRQLQKDRQEMYKLKRQLMNERYQQQRIRMNKANKNMEPGKSQPLNKNQQTNTTQ